MKEPPDGAVIRVTSDVYNYPVVFERSGNTWYEVASDMGSQWEWIVKDAKSIEIATAWSTWCRMSEI